MASVSTKPASSSSVASPPPVGRGCFFFSLFCHDAVDVDVVVDAAEPAPASTGT